MRACLQLLAVAFLLIAFPTGSWAATNHHATLRPEAEAVFQKLSERAKRGDFGPDVLDAKARMRTETARIDFVYKDGIERGFLLLTPRAGTDGTRRSFSIVADPQVSDDDVRRLAIALDELFTTSPWQMGGERAPTVTPVSVIAPSDHRSFFDRSTECKQGEFGHCLVISVIEPMMTQRAGRRYAAFAIGLICLVVLGGLVVLWTVRPIDETESEKKS